MTGMYTHRFATILKTTLSGLLAVGLAAATAAPALGQASPATTTFTTLATFNGTDGQSPVYVGLVQGLDGNFYGTTKGGGANKVCFNPNDPKKVGCGTVFKITPGGTLTTLHSFDGTDGSFPKAGLVLASNGNFYGTTSNGGASTSSSCPSAFNGQNLGCGTVFEITPGGTLTTLHSFDGTDGSVPLDGLVQASNGNFYGTTYTGGASSVCPNGCGTVFEITPSGTLTTLHSFDKTDGALPYAGLVQASNGNLYGTTDAGGVSISCPENNVFTELGCGTVFEITSSGTLTTLHNFGITDGSFPVDGLVQATDGNFYGTTSLGGSNCSGGLDPGCGTVFKITPAGTLTTLHSFDSTDGSQPFAGLVQATDGNFYGTTVAGGTNTGCGTIFEITPGGTLTTLVDLGSGSTKGVCDPFGGLLQATNGNFYGTTTVGDGTVFSLAVGLGPFVVTNPASGGVGTDVTILGNNLTGSTSVTFNGVQATFNVVSSTEITTTVPSGATTGKVQVKTPSGTLSSNVNFRVP